jgi:hypothetical protein
MRRTVSIVLQLLAASAVLTIHGKSTVRPGLATLDRSGTPGCGVQDARPQVKLRLRLATARSFPTERTGFEPVVGCNPYTGLANRRYRPLSHLSRPLLDPALAWGYVATRSNAANPCCLRVPLSLGV